MPQIPVADASVNSKMFPYFHRCAWCVTLMLAIVPAAFVAGEEPRPLGEKPLREFEPDLVGRPERLPLYLQRFQRAVIRDPRLFAFEARARWSADDGVQVTGFFEFSEQRMALLQLLRELGFQPVHDALESLPSAKLGGQRFGLVESSHTFSYDRPSADGEVVTDCLLGEPLCLLRDAESGFVLCHSGEGYVGYVDGRDIRRLDHVQLLRYQSGRQVLVRENHAAATKDLPIGARLKWCGQTEETFSMLLPSGQIATLPIAKGALVEETGDAAVEPVIAHAERLLGSPYLWGGKTSTGIDCSGLVQTSFAAAGIHLPRDSDQQAYLGRLTATRWSRSGLRRGDTLYFLRADGRIGHTAIYLGENRYLEAVRPVVRITSFDPEDPDYSASRDASFAFAKRLFERSWKGSGP